jgi:hypothetical protein
VTGADAEALMFLSLLVGWHGGHLPVYADGGRGPYRWLQTGSVSQLGEELRVLAEELDFERSAQVEIGLPQAIRYGGVAKLTVLWAWCENRDAVRRAHRRFRPAPTMVLRMGASCRRLLLWGLREPLSELTAEGDNKRIAYALHAPQKYAQANGLRIPLPGTFLRVGRSRPAPVLVTLMADDAIYPRSQVVAGLREPPAPFMQRVREGRAEIRR